VFQAREALTFDDVLLVPRYSEVHPTETDLTTRFTRGIDLKAPLVSAAMDTVTESRLAIAVARQGGIGVIHRNLSAAEQAEEVERVKKSESGVIHDPIYLAPSDTVADAERLMSKYHIAGIPLVEGETLVGIVTNRDLRFETRQSRPLRELMTPREELVTAPVGTSLEGAQRMLQEHRIEKLPLVDDEFRLKGLITIKDIAKVRQYPNAAKDPKGRLRVAAAVGTSDETMDRVAGLVEAGVDAVVIDTAHGDSLHVVRTVELIKGSHPELQVVAGNVATAEGAKRLAGAGADGVKVGVGPGSICTTRVVTGVGVPQFSAIADCVEALDGSGVPIIADGGIRYSGDIVKSLAAGASCVMLGSMLAGTEESPGEKVYMSGRAYKVYDAMGSIAAMRRGSGGRERYRQEDVGEARKLVAEGVESRVPYRGTVGDVVYQMLGGVRAGMGYLGASTIGEIREKAQFVRLTPAGVRESHPHDVYITGEAPNYQVVGPGD